MSKLLKIGMISCEDLPKWGGIEGSCKLAIDVFESKSGLGNDCSKYGEVDSVQQISWTPFNAISCKLPDQTELKNYDGFVMTGSHYSAKEEAPWMLKLEEWIRQVKHYQENNKEHKPKIVGLCFSHQLINKALGGKVGRNPKNEFVWNTETIQLNSCGKEHAFFNNEMKLTKDNFRLFESHGECVLEPAPGAVTLASSPTCKHEITAINDNIFTIQSHPEFTAELMIDIILPSLKEKGLITDKKAAEAITTFSHEMDDKFFITLMKLFFAK